MDLRWRGWIEQGYQGLLTPFQGVNVSPNQKLFSSAVCVTLCGASLSSCGLGTPLVQSPLRRAPTDQVVVNIVLHVKHELECVAYALKINDTGYRQGNATVKNLPWLDHAVAKVTLNLTVDEKSSFSPSLQRTTIFENSVSTFAHGGDVTSGQSFTMGLSGSLSAEANRKLSADYTYSVPDDLLHDNDYVASHCDAMTGALKKPYAGLMINGDLKIGDSLVGLLKPNLINNRPLGVTVDTSNAPDTLSADVTFTADASGSLGPTWTLSPVSYFPNQIPLTAASRNTIDEVIVTIGASGAATDRAHDIAKAGSLLTTATR